jgi:hypothetical protein
MLLLRSCRRCKGDLYLERDSDTGDCYVACLQCGARTYIPKPDRHEVGSVFGLNQVTFAGEENSEKQSHPRVAVAV